MTSFAPERPRRAGKQYQYVGAGGPIVFTESHNSTGAFEAVKYVSGNPRQSARYRRLR